MAPFPGSARVMPAVVCVVSAASALLLTGCDEKTDANVAKVVLNGQPFYLEIVADDDSRFKGMGGRTSVADDGGMLFVFPSMQMQVQSFVMRDCLVDLDIIFLDAAGRILAMHNMKKEDPRGPDEAPDAQGYNEKYDARLKRYSSRYPSQFVIELKGGTLQSLNLKEGDLVKQKWDELKRLAK